MSELSAASDVKLLTPGARWERLIVWHTALFLIAASWMFGGRIYWAYLPLAIWGTIGGIICILVLIQSPLRLRRNLLWLLPWAGLNIMILCSVGNPSFQEFIFFDQRSLRPISHHTWLPSSAAPAQTLRDLWLYNGLYLSAFNLMIGVRTRRSLRTVFIVAIVNVGILAVWGTIQKLVGYGILFGLETSPNPSFFSTFIYHNHWGAFALINASAGLGLAVYYLHRQGAKSFWHSPVMLVLVAVLLVLISIPMSTSRSTSLLMLLLGMVSTVYAFRWVRKRFRSDYGSQLRAIVLLSTGVIAALGFIYHIASPIIYRRFQDTINQVERRNHYAFVPSQQVFYGESRILLYQDTLRMFVDNPVWGWGYGTYGTVFLRYNTQTNIISRNQTYYLDAHSDWLEALAEIGVVGTLLLIGLAGVPLLSARRYVFRSGETWFPIFGCAMIAGYALVEFPFANPAVSLSFWVILFGASRFAMINEANSSKK